MVGLESKVENVGGSGIGIILGRHRGIGYREKEDRELEGHTQGREGRGGWGGSCIAEAAVEATGNAEEEERILYGGIRRLEGARNSDGVGLLSPSPPLPFSGPPPPPLLAHPV